MGLAIGAAILVVLDKGPRIFSVIGTAICTSVISFLFIRYCITKNKNRSLDNNGIAVHSRITRTYLDVDNDGSADSFQWRVIGTYEVEGTSYTIDTVFRDAPSVNLGDYASVLYRKEDAAKAMLWSAFDENGNTRISRNMTTSYNLLNKNGIPGIQRPPESSFGPPRDRYLV